MTKILTRIASPSVPANDITQTQASVKVGVKRNAGALSELTILLPLLIHLCETRASLNADPECMELTMPQEFTGLDRVLHWLIRLLQLPPGSSSLVVPQLALQLAHLLGGGCGSGNERRSNDGSSFTWDDLVILLSADVRSVLGDVEEVGISQVYSIV